MFSLKKITINAMFIILITTPLKNAFSDCLIANYQFDGSANDNTGLNSPMVIKNAPLVDNSLSLNGIYSWSYPLGDYTDDTGYTAVANLNKFSYKSFSVSLDFKPLSNNSDSNWSGNILTGGTSYRWFGLNYDKNGFYLTLNNGGNIYAFKRLKLNANTYHNVMVSFNLNKKIIFTMVDGKFFGNIRLDNNFSLDVIKDNIDYDKQFTFTNYSYGGVFNGYADNLRIYNCALSN